MVYFVGAGPGAADLITVRGMRLLEQADVVIYAGSLVNPELLSYCKKECEIHNSAYMTLEEVLAVMEEAEKQKLTTVRLHTGEPSIYGAVREQMDLLDEKGILYESCPGVSACFGAAALLNLEYTLPEVSQSLIITRMEGRTKVPERESIESFAAHHASMAIYLSTGMIGELGRRLIAGGYGKDTPAAIVYKATWPEEEAYLCTVEQLEETAKAHDITKTALIIVGDIVAHQNYGKSRLYAPDFETEFRKIKNQGKRMNISIITFTENGTKLAEKIRQAFVGTKTEEAKKLGLSLSDWTRQQFAEKNAIVVIGACGIAVRMIAPFVSDKLSDSPVVVADEAGTFVIPLLSGHMGGANELAEQIAGQIGGIPVITTATDVNHTFSVDLFAKKCGLSIYNREGIAKVSSKILDGKTPDIVISSEKTDLEQGVLGLQPREYILGIGCRRGKSFEELDAFIQKWLDHAGIEKRLVRAAASIDLKKEEEGLLRWCMANRIPFLTYSAEELKQVKGDFQESSFVKEKTGVDNVCERAAMKAANEEGTFILRKQAENGITIAIVKYDWKLERELAKEYRIDEQ